ncbi:hypothetical protein JCM10212_003036 [Sporobolomyces blumeae]
MSPAPAPGSPTLLETLQALTKVWQTRHALVVELEQAMDSFLTSTPIPLDGAHLAGSPAPAASDARHPTTSDHAQESLATRTASSCSTEASSSAHIRPPNQVELEQLLSISFEGLVQVKSEAVELSTRPVVTRNPRIQGAVGRIEEWESQRIKVILETEQLRRLAMLQPDLEFSASITEKNRIRDELARQIQEEKTEIHAEIADLAAEAEDGHSSA